uniref:Uncharacterized protein n=1 Tax=Panagrolaimus sp. JU765 TaxID=591449 RepID=A0AC34QGA9_9BILA
MPPEVSKIMDETGQNSTDLEHETNNKTGQGMWIIVGTVSISSVLIGIIIAIMIIIQLYRRSKNIQKSKNDVPKAEKSNEKLQNSIDDDKNVETSPTAPVLTAISPAKNEKHQNLDLARVPSDFNVQIDFTDPKN